MTRLWWWAWDRINSVVTQGQEPPNDYKSWSRIIAEQEEKRRRNEDHWGWD